MDKLDPSFLRDSAVAALNILLNCEQALKEGNYLYVYVFIDSTYIQSAEND